MPECSRSSTKQVLHVDPLQTKLAVDPKQALVVYHQQTKPWLLILRKASFVLDPINAKHWLLILKTPYDAVDPQETQPWQLTLTLTLVRNDSPIDFFFADFTQPNLG
jgi:hypothetical protein